MERAVSGAGLGRIVRYAGCYGLWLLTIALGYVVIGEVWRSALRAVVVALIDETDIDARASGGAVYLFGITIMLVGLFAMVMAVEPYLRNGVERGMLLRRFGRVAAPLVGAGVLGLLVQVVAWLAA